MVIMDAVGIPIGIQGEDGAHAICFDIKGLQECYGTGGTVRLWLWRPGESEPYYKDLTVTDHCVKWVVDSYDDQKYGAGKAELHYCIDGKTIKSPMIVTCINQSPTGEVTVTASVSTIETLFEEAKDAVKAATAKAEAASASAEASAASADQAAEAITSANAATEAASEATTAANTATEAANNAVTTAAASADSAETQAKAAALSASSAASATASHGEADMLATGDTGDYPVVKLGQIDESLSGEGLAVYDVTISGTISKTVGSYFWLKVNDRISGTDEIAFLPDSSGEVMLMDAKDGSTLKSVSVGYYLCCVTDDSPHASTIFYAASNIKKLAQLNKVTYEQVASGGIRLTFEEYDGAFSNINLAEQTTVSQLNNDFSALEKRVKALEDAATATSAVGVS